MKDTGALLIACYGIFAFTFLFFDINDITPAYRKLYATSYTFIEYLFFAVLVALNTNNKIIRKLIIVLSGLFLVFQCIYFFTAKAARLDSIPVGVETILLFIYIFLFFYENFKITKSEYIYNMYGFWVAIGILLYLGGAFFVYILANHLQEDELEQYWDLTYVAEILKNILFAVSIFLYKRNSKDNPNNSKATLPYLDIN